MKDKELRKLIGRDGHHRQNDFQLSGAVPARKSPKKTSPGKIFRKVSRKKSRKKIPNRINSS